MTGQRPIAPKEAPDYEFRRQYSLHKVWIAFKKEDRKSKTHYAKDYCDISFEQLLWGHVKAVVFSYQTSMNDCLRLEEIFRGQYRTLQIYRRNDDGTFPKEPILKYVDGKQVYSNDDCLPTDKFYTVDYTAPPAGSRGVPFTFHLKPSQNKPVRIEHAAESMPPVKDPVSKRLATDPTKLSHFIPGSAARYGFKR